MSKAFRVLFALLLSLTASAWLGATGVAPVAPVAPAAEAAPAVPAAPAEMFGSGEAVYVDSGGGSSYLGVDVQDVTKERVAALKLKEERGAEINMVDQDAPAGKAGLKEHDVILEFNGARVESVEQLRRLIHEVPPGRTVTLGVSRDGQPLTLKATLADRKKSYSYAWPKMKEPKVVIPRMPEMPAMEFVITGFSGSGLLVENLTPQLGEYFGVKNGAGVLVRSVEKGSPAEAAGFKAGDIIIRVEQEKVADRGDWRSTMRSHRSGKVSIGIIRDKREQTLSLALPESKEQSSVWRFETPDLDDLNYDLEDMDIEINRLAPEMEKLRPQLERMKPQMEQLKERMKRELSVQLTASLAASRDQLRKEMEAAREQQRAARSVERRAQLEAVRAAQQAQRDALRAARQAQSEARRAAQRAIEQQRRELDKARLLMLRQSEMD